MRWKPSCAGNHHALETIIDHGVQSRREAEQLIIPCRTLSHCKRRGEPLTTDESYKLARVAVLPPSPRRP
jgi:uncharacterized protein (DUF2384 family)